MNSPRPLSVLNLYRKQLVILLSVFSIGAVGMLLVTARLLHPYYVDDLAQQASQALRPVETELISMLLQQDYSAAHQLVDGPRFAAPAKTRELRLFALDEYARTGLLNTCGGWTDLRPWGLICHERDAVRIELPVKSADNTLAHIIVSSEPSIWGWKPFLLLASALGVLLVFGASAAWVLLMVFKRRVAQPMEEKVRRLASAKDLEELNMLIKEVAIHEHRQLADMIVERQVALQKANHELALMGEKQRLFREASQLVHDVKTPIAGVAAQADQLSITTDEKSALRTGLGRIRELLEGYLAKVQPHTLEHQSVTKADAPQDIDQPCLGILLNLLKQSYIQYANQCGVSLELDMPRKAWVIALNCNESKIERALTNLLANAIDAAASSTLRKVRMHVSVGACAAEISFIDSGPGFPAELLTALLNRNGQTTKQRGTGMGFIGALDTINSYGGLLRVSRTGEFTAVIATIPVATGETWLYDPAKENPAVVLSIDDDQLFHQLLKQRMPGTRFEAMTEIPMHGPPSHKNYDRVFVDYDLGNGATGLDYILAADDKSRTCLVSGMIAIDRSLYGRLRAQKVKSVPKEYFYEQT